MIRSRPASAIAGQRCSLAKTHGVLSTGPKDLLNGDSSYEAVAVSAGVITLVVSVMPSRLWQKHLSGLLIPDAVAPTRTESGF